MAARRSSAERVRLERRGAVAWLTLDRPDAMNAIDPETVRQFDEALSQVERDPELKVGVVTGTGQAFCSGADLKAVGRISGLQERAAAAYEFLRAANALMRRIDTFPKPIIAAVNGVAFAGGLELVLCCDLVIASETAVFGDVHARHGLIPGWGGSVRLPRKIGVNRAKELLLTGETRSAAVMREWGLVNQVVAAGELVHAASSLASTLASRSPLGLRRMKQLIDDGLEQSLEIALRAERVMCEAHNGSNDRAEGIRAFAEKRAPVFTGT